MPRARGLFAGSLVDQLLDTYVVQMSGCPELIEWLSQWRRTSGIHVRSAASGPASV